jgi:transcription elongation GreA/GreB family factor
MPATDLNLPTKPHVCAALQTVLTEQLHSLAAAVQAAVSGATDAEARPENKYDTRALEQSYLAAGQTERIEALRLTLGALHNWQPPPNLSRVEPGALVQVNDTKGIYWVFVTPFAAAATLQVAGLVVQTVWRNAPLALALLGKGAGDEVTVKVAGGQRELEILAVY